MSENKQRPIILNHMYSGEYLGDNIGHEIINLFKADDGNNYIYLCKDGKYNGEFPKYVIQVRRYGTRMLEVVNIAEVDTEWDWNSVKEPRKKKEKATWKEKRAEAIKLIKYGEVDIESIFKENKEQGTDTFVTFKAKQVVKPKSPVYISYKGNRKNASKEVDEGENENTTSLTSLLTTEPIVLEQKKEDKYLFDVSESLRNIVKYTPAEESDYQKLKKLAEEAFVEWIKFNKSDQIEINNESRDRNEEDIEDTPGDIYRINNLELPYSNAFKYFIYKYPTLLSEFCNYLLKNEEYIKSDDKLERLCQYLNNDKNECKLTIRREWENIDIIIEVDKKWLIVIENKIFSDLNGKTKKEITQLDKYYDIINDGIKLLKDKNGEQKGEEIKKIPEHYKDCEKIFILLTPNHNDINISNYKVWRKLHYSHINKFLKSISKDKKSQHLREFEKMIEQHSVNDYNYGVMKRRFERALIKAKNSESK